MRFVLLAEGDTEKLAIGDFLKRWLDPQLNDRVGVKVVNFKGNAQLVRKIVAKAQDYLDGPDASEIVAVIGLLDLYGLDIYPAGCTTAEDRYGWAVKHFEFQVSRSKFRMFFAVHEVEAWLLSQPDIFPRSVRDALPRSAERPEAVDFDTPPARLLNDLYCAHTPRSYKKTTYGKQLFGRLNPAVAVQKCPHLKSMLEEMLQLAKEAGL